MKKEEERNKQIIEELNNGASQRELAKKFGITATRVANIYETAERIRKMETSKNPYSVLYRFLKKDTRTLNVLWKVNIKDIESLRKIFNAGHLSEIKGIGPSAYEHIKNVWRNKI